VFQLLRFFVVPQAVPLVLCRPAKVSEVIAADGHVLLEGNLDAHQLLLGVGFLNVLEVDFCFVRHGFVPPMRFFFGAVPLAVTVYYRLSDTYSSGYAARSSAPVFVGFMCISTQEESHHNEQKPPSGSPALGAYCTWLIAHAIAWPPSSKLISDLSQKFRRHSHSQSPVSSGVSMNS